VSLLSARGLEFAYRPGEKVLEGLDLDLAAGELVGILGPNGSGKSTLMKVMCGILSPQAGEVLLEGRPLSRIPRRHLARRIAFVPQEARPSLAFTCGEVVMMGRYPHMRGLGLGEGQHLQVVRRCMEATGVAHLARRRITEVSGGEAQRVRIAQALAQESRILLLDEPTSHLDINFQIEVMDLLRRLHREEGLTVVLSLHDLNLASLYCERLVLLQQGRLLCQGPPPEVLTPSVLRQAFQVEVEIAEGPLPGRPRVFPLPGTARPLSTRRMPQESAGVEGGGTGPGRASPGSGAGPFVPGP
jgi:iron complex transport system ATP-binding protein